MTIEFLRIAAIANSRHRAALRRHVGSVRVEYSTGGNIAAAAVARLLEPTYGRFANLWFKRFTQAPPHIVEFEGITQHDRIVRGSVVLHAAFNDATILSWGEVLIEDDRLPF